MVKKKQDIREFEFRAVTREGAIIRAIGSIELFSDGDIIVNEEIPVSRLLQCTGVKDKTYQHIFEGDIVEAWDNGRKAVFEVRYRNEGAPMFILWPAYQQGEFWNLHGPQDMSCLVIGNIFENPQLIVKGINARKKS